MSKNWFFFRKPCPLLDNVGYLKTCMYLFYSLAELFLELEIFQTKFVEKIKAHFMSKNCFFSKTVPFIR